MRKIVFSSLLLALLLVLAGCGDSNDNENGGSSTPDTEQKSDDKVDDVVEEEDDEEAQKEVSNEASSALQWAIGFLEESEGKINDDGINFADNNGTIFVNHEEQPLEEINEAQILKSPASQGEVFTSLSGQVLDADEQDLDGEAVTYLQVAFDDTYSVYQIFYDGSIDVFVDDYVTVDGLILGVIQDETMDGGYDNFPIIISNKITKH